MEILLFAMVVLATLYWIGALACVSAFGRRSPRPSRFRPPVSVLKPLRGDDGSLYLNLRSFCEQDYPTLQVLFGVQDADDPAVAVVDRLIRDFPDRDLRLVIADDAIGTNLKVNTLIGLAGHAAYDMLIISDSDMRVGRDYVSAVVAPLADPGVGLVTCLYHGVAEGGVASMLGAMFINEWFFPAAVVGACLEPLRHAFGATMACRRDTLLAIGGFEALADQLADDYMLGRLVSSQGLRIVLASYVVDNIIAERDLQTLYFRELRWTRTFRMVRPLSYFFTFLTYGLPLCLLWLITAGPSQAVAVALAAHLVLRSGGRAILYRALHRPVPWATTWLVPIRDGLTFMLWAMSFVGRNVRWNDERFRVRADGHLERSAQSSTPPPASARSLLSPSHRRGRA